MSPSCSVFPECGCSEAIWEISGSVDQTCDRQRFLWPIKPCHSQCFLWPFILCCRQHFLCLLSCVADSGVCLVSHAIGSGFLGQFLSLCVPCCTTTYFRKSHDSLSSCPWSTVSKCKAIPLWKSEPKSKFVRYLFRLVIPTTLFQLNRTLKGILPDFFETVFHNRCLYFLILYQNVKYPVKYRLSTVITVLCECVL